MRHDDSLDHPHPADAGPGLATVRQNHAWHVWVGYILAAVALVWVLSDVDTSELILRVRVLGWTAVGLAIVFDTSSYLIQGWRWSLLLLPSGRLSSFRATEAIYAGLFVNEILPMRLGEILRGYVVSRRIPASATAVASSIVVERILDGIWMVLAVGIITFTIPLPSSLLTAEELLALAVLGAVFLLIWAALRRQQRPPADSFPSSLAGRLRRLPIQLADELGRTTRSPALFGAFVLSGIHLALQLLAYWFVIVAYHLQLSPWQGVAVALIVRLGTMVPGAPSNLGTYQFFTVVGLALFGVDKVLAAGFSFVVFVVLTAPLWVIGLLAFGHSGLSLSDLRKQMKRLVESAAP